VALDEDGVIDTLKACPQCYVYQSEYNGLFYITCWGDTGHVPVQVLKAMIDSGKLVDRYPDKPHLNCYNLRKEAAE